MVLAHNLAAMNTQRRFNIVGTSKKKSTEKLSSGYKINRAADDAAGLTISEKMRSQIRGLNQGAENVQSGISYVQVAEGALAEVTDMMHRLTELSVQSANGTNTVEDREAIDKEVQQLKTEMQRVFTSTEFNTMPIWDEPTVLASKEIREPVPSTYEQVATFPSNITRLAYTNDLYDKVAFNDGYKIIADDFGVSITWDDYNGDNHTTNAISWEELKSKNYRFEIGDYLTDDLKDSLGKPLINFTFDLNVNSAATTDNIKNYIDGKYYRVGNYIEGTIPGSGPNGTYVIPNLVNIAFASAKYGTTTDKYDFSKSNNDSFIKPVVSNGTNLSNISGNNTSSVSVAENSTDPWKLKFYVDGFGEIETECSYVEYNERLVSFERLMDKDGNETGSLSAAMSVMDKGYIFNKETFLEFRFDIDSSTPVKSMWGGVDNTLTSLIVTLDLRAGDTKESLLNKINLLFSDTKVINMKQLNDSGVHSISSPSNTTNLIEVTHPDKVTTIKEYAESNKDLWIHAGPSKDDGLHIVYDNLRLETLGLENTSVDTRENALKAIEEVSNALKVVSEQRTQFGAYQNRLEHTYNNDLNIAENTQAAESRIRDTDMATEMVNNTKLNILEQAVTSMMTQANQSTQGVLSLLQ